ncbi:MAG TPA: MBL fold metallo-hydrolase [Flavobacteriaceae bacterium]|nr:MBL fold metallo-hydrolase [Flavobacteriaceae bacterium]
MTTPGEIDVLDLNFLAESHVIANYLIESDDGLILIETGPETTFENLKSAIAKVGYDWKDVKHVFLTHIHFDHAGAAWKFAENNAKIYVHPIGLPHMSNPEKLWNSAKRIYKDDMEVLWGEMKPIDDNLLIPAEDGDEFKIGEFNIKTHYTPGHAIHHNAYQIGEIVFTGDVAGVKINDGPVVPPCPPPDIDLKAWEDSIKKLRQIDSETMYLAHYGPVTDIAEHLDALEKMLKDWALWIKPYYDVDASPKEITPKFVEYTQKQLRESGVDQADIEKYEKGNPSFMSVTGLMRYWKLKEQGRL